MFRSSSLVRLVLINLLVFLGLLLGFEVAARIFLSIADKHKNLEEVPSSNNKVSKKNTKVFRKSLICTEDNAGKTGPFSAPEEKVFHPGVGHANSYDSIKRNPNTQGLAHSSLYVKERFASKASSPRDSKNILILGGSTSDPLGTRFSGCKGTWPHHLFREAAGLSGAPPFNVFNAGIGGATSSNELTRMISVLHDSDIDLILSYNGINEIYFMDGGKLSDVEFVLAPRILVKALELGQINYQEDRIFLEPGSRASKAMEDKKLVGLLEGFAVFDVLQRIGKGRESSEVQSVNREPDPSQSQHLASARRASKIWFNNVRSMHAISSMYGAKYLVVLQPTLGLGLDYCRDQSSKCMLYGNNRYLFEIRSLYKELRAHCALLDFCVDLSRAPGLIDDESFYTDPRHPNSLGNRSIARLLLPRVMSSLRP